MSKLSHQFDTDPETGMVEGSVVDIGALMLRYEDADILTAAIQSRYDLDQLPFIVERLEPDTNPFDVIFYNPLYIAVFRWIFNLAVCIGIFALLLLIKVKTSARYKAANSFMKMLVVVPVIVECVLHCIWWTDPAGVLGKSFLERGFSFILFLNEVCLFTISNIYIFITDS